MTGKPTRCSGRALKVTTRFQISALLVVLAGCEAADPSETAPVPGPSLSVCEAGRQPVGSTVLVRGEFDGFGYETNSRRAMLVTDELCSDRGAGFVVAHLAHAREAEKPGDVQPRDERRRIAGGFVTISGRIRKIDDGRFVHLEDGLVRLVER